MNIRGWRQAAAVGTALVGAVFITALQGSPVLAECVYLPPWPPITTAVPSARSIIVGRIVTNFHESELHLPAGQEAPDYALRVTVVLRGPHRVGDLVDVEYLLPNWPQMRVAGDTESLASCSYLRLAPGNLVALAFDALQPGGPMHENGVTWQQPPTRYNALGIIEGPSYANEFNLRREVVTLAQLRALAALPPTDTASVPAVDHSLGGPALAGLAGVLAAWAVMRRLSGRELE
jgi:hypothetical protein